MTRDAIWAARTLRRYELPPEEISAVLEADNPELVRRYMELHRERLQERHLDRLHALADLERFLVQAITLGRARATRHSVEERSRRWVC